MEAPTCSDPHPGSGDCSPRISFSYGFSAKQRIPSPARTPILHDSEFEFSSHMGVDLTPKWSMMSAEELFCDGKLRFFDSSSEGSGRTRAEEPPSVDDGGNVCRVLCVQTEGNAPERKSPTSRGGNGDAAGDVSKRSERRDQADALRSATIRGDLVFACETEKPRSPTSTDATASAQKLRRSENAGKSKSPTSREELVVSAQKPKRRSPRCREDVISAQKLEMGNTAGKTRSPTGREDLIPAIRPDSGPQVNKLRSPTRREEFLLACGRLDGGKSAEKTESIMKGEARLPAIRTSSKSAGSMAVAGKCDETRTPVKWRGELRPSSKKNEDEHERVLQSRRFSRHPRSASMAVEGFSRLANRACVSLNSSRCPSPTRSFSLPATMPTSPTASGSSSVFSSSSSSSLRYRGRIKEFFKLKKLASRETSSHASDSSSFKLPFSPRSFFPFFKGKETSSNSTNSTSPLSQQAHDRHCSHAKDSCSGTNNEQTVATNKGQVSALPKNLDNCNELTGQNAKPHPKQTVLMNLSPSLACKADALTSSDRALPNLADSSAGSQFRMRHAHSLPSEKVGLGKDGQLCYGMEDSLWNDAKNNGLYFKESPGKQSNPKSTRVERGSSVMMMGNSGVSLGRHKGLERPISYTSSVRVTPVLNVPSCITPSLRKGKPSSRSKTFSLDSLFPRSKGKVPMIAPTSEG